jgi:CRP-like cAMP-binding protein
MSETAQDPAELLAGIDLFSGLSRRQFKRLLSLAREVQHQPGHEVAHEGLGSLAFHLVLAGQVSVSRNGRELRRLGPGEYFGEISMIDGKPRSATVTAEEPTRTLVVPHTVFEDLLREEPEFATGLLRLLCARLREAEVVT